MVNHTFDNDTGRLLDDSADYKGISAAPTYLWLIIGFFIIIIGTIGHVLSLVVLCSSRCMRPQSSTVYLIAMSITGLLSIYTGLLRYVIVIGFNDWEVDPIRETAPVSCVFHMSATYASLQYFAWLQATTAIDRVSFVISPVKYRIHCKWLSALIVVLIELAAVIVLNTVFIQHFLQTDIDDEGVCTPHDKDWYKIWGYVDLVSYSLLPATILIISNFAILILLNKCKMRTESGNSVARSLTVMLMALNLMFVVTTLPISVFFFCKVPDFGTREYLIYDVIWTIFSLFQYSGSACTFFAYCVSGSRFREELRKLICGKKRARRGLSITLIRSTEAPL